jgi:hypothetical protein
VPCRGLDHLPEAPASADEESMQSDFKPAHFTWPTTSRTRVSTAAAGKAPWLLFSCECKPRSMPRSPVPIRVGWPKHCANHSSSCQPSLVLDADLRSFTSAVTLMTSILTPIGQRPLWSHDITFSRLSDLTRTIMHYCTPFVPGCLQIEHLVLSAKLLVHHPEWLIIV